MRERISRFRIWLRGRLQVGSVLGAVYWNAGTGDPTGHPVRRQEYRYAGYLFRPAKAAPGNPAQSPLVALRIAGFRLVPDTAGELERAWRYAVDANAASDLA
jgi:hypothetical protein